MRITTLAKNYFFYCVLLLTLFGQNDLVYSQCPTVTNASQSFCDTQSPTVASLQAINNGGGVRWYATAASTTPLPNGTVLADGEDYFADDNSGTCGTRQSVVVTIYSAPSGANFQGVCVTSLSQATPSNPQFVIIGNNLQWYTVPSGGTPISNATILNDNTIYYISQTNPAGTCQTSRLSVFVNVGLVPVPTGSAVQEFCNLPGSPPTIADLVASGNNNWYLTSDFGIPLDPSTPLLDGQFYYATTVDPPCESNDRLEVLVNIYEPNDAGNNGNRSICLNEVASTSPFDLFNLLGGSPDNTGVWSGPITTANGFQGTLNVSGMTLAGSPYVFTYTVSSALCAPDTSTVTITILPTPTVAVSVSPTTICSGDSGTFTFTGTPNATVTYNINSGFNQTITLNASGTATITGTYSATTIINVISVASSGTPSCVNPQTSSVTLTVQPLPTVAVSVNPTTICTGSNATFTFTGTPNATVTYTINGGVAQSLVLNASGTGTITGTFTTNTTVNISSVVSSGTPNCINPQTSSVTLTVQPLPTAVVSVSPTTICSGANGTFTFTGTPNATVTYNINSGFNQTITLSASGTATITGTYTTNTTVNIISVASAGTPSCVNPQASSVTLTIQPLPTVVVSVSPTTICSGASGTFTFAGTPNATVTYNINGGANQTITLNASGTATITGTYTANTTINIISVASSGTPSCVNPQTSSVTLTVQPLPTVTVSVSPTTICSGASGTFTFTGTPNAIVTYNINSGFNQTITLSASGTATITGTYTANTTINIVSVATSTTPSCLNPQTSSVTLTIQPLPTAAVSVSPTTICSGASGTFTFTGTPNATVTYNINGGFNQTITLNASGTATITGMYTTNTTINIISVASSGTPSCVNPQTSSVTLTIQPLPTVSVSVSPTTICSGASGTFTFTGTPNATVTYNINGGSNQTVVLNASGTATITGTYTANTTINISSVASSGTPSCVNPQTSNVTLTVQPLPTVVVLVSPTTICSGSNGTFTFTGTPNATVTYNINGGANQTIVLNASGTATLTGTYTANTTITIISVANAGTPSCVNPQTSSVTLTIQPLPTVAVSVNPTTICPGASATFTFTGTPNATVTYNINGGTNQTFILNASGTRTITGTYSANTTINIISVVSAGTPSCVNPQTSSVTLTIQPLPTATVSVSPTTICAGSSGTFTFTGTPNATVTYNINGGASQTIVLNALGAATITGTYTANTTVNIISVATSGTPGCVNPQTSSVTLNIRPLPTVAVSVSPTTICSGGSGTFTFTGTPNATVSYNINGGTNQTIVLNASGTATLTGTYTANTTINIISITSAGTPGCVNPQTSSVTLTIQPLPTAAVSVSPTIICSGASGTFTFTGTPNATVTYNINGGFSQTITLNASGTATITGTYTTNTTINIISVASSGTPSCVNPQTSSVTLTIQPLPTVAVSVSPTTICSGESSTFTFTGTPNSSVTYNINGGFSQTITLNVSGTATITGIYTANTTINIISVASSGTPGCVNPQTSSVTLTIQPLPTVAVSVNPTTICSGGSGTFTFTGTPNATVTYNINGGFNQTITLNGSGTATITGTYTSNTTINIVSVVSAGTPSCSNPQPSSVTLTIQPLPTVAVSVSPTTICSGTSGTFTFTGTPNATVTYNINGGFNQTINLNASGTATISGTYSANTTINIISVASSGTPSCVNPQASSVTLTVADSPIAGVSTSTTVCVLSPSFDLFTLLGPTAQTGGTWSPSLASGTGVFNPSVDAAGTYTYLVLGTNPCPSSSATVQVTINPVPNAGNDGTLVICSNQNPVDLFNSLSGTPQTGGTWTPALASGTGIFNPAVDAAGVYTYTITGVSPCVDDTATVTVSVTPGPEAGTDNSVTLCVNSPAQDLALLLGPNSQPGGIWSPAMASGTGVFNPAVDAPGAYTYTLSGTLPCDNDVATIIVTVNPVPNAGDNTTLTLCSNSPAQDLFLLLGPNAQTGGTWSPALASGTGVFNPAIDLAATYTYSVGGGLCATDTADVVVTITQAPNSGGIGQTLNACLSATSVDLLTGLDGTQQTGTWNDDDATGALFGNTFNPSTIGVGTYHFTYTVTGTPPCVNATSTVTVIVNPLPIAGNSSTLNLCSNAAAQDLFVLLGSTAQTGGTWSPALASGSGVFNPAIDPQGNYTYTVTSAFCASASATVNVTVIPAANSGGIGQTVNTCINVTSLNLFTGLDGTQGTGTWNDDDASGALTGTVFNPSAVALGTYHFTYTVIGTSPCPNASSTVTVIVNPVPNAGTFTGTIPSLCPSVGVLDLATLLTGQNTGGVWTDSGNQVVTSPITIINFAAGTYSYTYTVTNSCGSDTETVQFTILANPQISSVNISISPACLGSNVVVNLNGMVDGTYTISYDLAGANTLPGQTAIATIAAGAGSFTIPTASLPNIGTTVISLTNIVNTVTNCSSALTNVTAQIQVRPLADIDSTNLNAVNVCLGSDVIVTITNAVNLPDGVYQFNYSVPGANPTNGVTATVTVTGGVGQFNVPGGIFTSAGNYTLTVIGIVAATGCTNSNENATVNFTIVPIPTLTTATITVQDTCANFASVVTISGAANLPDGDYTIIYQLTGANTASNTVTVTFATGSGSFTIPATDLINNGSTVLTINQINSVTTNCGIGGNVANPTTFNVTDVGTPQLIQDGNLFCEDDNPTIENLSGNLVGFPTVIWYDAATGGTAYNSTDLLVHNTTYYAALTAASGCEGTVRLEVTVDLTACDDIFIPDGYSPNNDGINDTFEIPNLAQLYPNFKLEIYNRYGNLIYKGNRNTPNWDGTTSVGGLNLGDKLLPVGVYFYILDFNDGTRKAVQGRVYLNR